MDYRMAIIVSNPEQLVQALSAYAKGEKSSAMRFGRQTELSGLKEFLSTADLNSLVAQAVANRDLEALARFWTKGVNDIGWEGLHAQRPARCSLPTYPFEARTLWYDLDEPKSQPSPVVKSAIPKPTALVTQDVAEIKSRIVGIIRGILLLRDEDEVREDCTFFELGLDSITSARMVQRLSVELGRALPETVFFDFPTLRALSDHLASAPIHNLDVAITEARKTEVSTPAADSLRTRLQAQMKRFDEVIALQVEGNGPVLFCIHPMSGDVGLHGKLADAAGTDLRVIALKSRGASGLTEPLTDIESMGLYLADIIAGIDPEGPYWLFAPSMGGAVIYEIARQMQLRGKRVAALVMIEPPLMNSDGDAAIWDANEKDNWLMTANFILITYLHMDPEFRRRKSAGEVRWDGLEITRDELRDTEGETTIHRLVALIRARGVTQAADVLESRLRTMSAVHLANLRALKGYRPQPLPAPEAVRPILLRTRDGVAVAPQMYNPIYLEEVQKSKGGMLPYFAEWNRLFPHLETRIITGQNHLDLLNTKAAAQEIADLLKAVMTDSQRSDPVQSAGTKTRIAIVGMAGQFASARNVDEFWVLLREGRTAWSEFPTDRGWNLEQMFSDNAGPHRSYVKTGGFLRDATGFDSAFFGISSREAEMMDPSERLFLMESWKAIEDAGVDPASISGRKWGVFCGGGGDYSLRVQELYGVSPHVTVSSFAGRVAYSLNLKGPVASLDAGCASSLLAVAHACDQLQMGKCETALAGGVLVYSTPNLIQTGCRNELFSRDQCACAFDERANGMMPGEAVGVLVLKRFDDAMRDGDRIHGVIEAWGSNHNGRTNGLAAPSASAQTELFTQVYREFGVDPASISFVEANATSARLSDSVEIQALTAAFREFTPQAKFCVLGSVENNVGHAFQASGMSHLTKVLLALRHQEIPASPGVENLNRSLADAESPFVVPRGLHAWKVSHGQLRRAAVSSFGATGVNVHLIVAEPPVTRNDSDKVTSAQTALICLAARSQEALLKRCEELRGLLIGAGDQVKLRQLAANLLMRQNRLAHRCALVVASSEQLITELSRLIEGQIPERGFIGVVPATVSAATLELGRRALGAFTSSSEDPSRLLELANLYVQGLALDPAQLFSKSERSTLSLPGYPFESRPYWVGLKLPSTRIVEPPVSSLLAEIQQLICDCAGLELTEVEPQLSLIELGLDSMASMRLLAALNERFSLDLQLADLIEHGSVQALRAHIEDVAKVDVAKATKLPHVTNSDASWISQRLANLPATLQVRSEPISSLSALEPSLEACELVLGKLTSSGVAIFHEGKQIHFFASVSLELAEILRHLSASERETLFTRLPRLTLFGPVSQEQERNLYHSEVMHQPAWNLQHSFTRSEAELDLTRLNKAIATVAEGQDVLKTCYRRIGETWVQIVRPEAVLQCDKIVADSAEAFQTRLVHDRSRLISVDDLPVFRFPVASIDGFWYLGLITHHSLADAFTSGMLLGEIEEHYRTLRAGGVPAARPPGSQYWQYALEQFDPAISRPASAREFWQAQFNGRVIVNRLPYAVVPSSLSPDVLAQARARVVSLSAKETSELMSFCKAHQTTLTQLFTAAVALLCGPGLGGEEVVLHYVNNQRNRWRLLKTLGEFTNVLFLPLTAPMESTLIDLVQQVNTTTLEALRHARFDFKALLRLAGLNGYAGYYNQVNDVVVDTVDFDAAEAASSTTGWRSISARVWSDERVSGVEGQALATWFFQVVKVEGVIHLIASYRKHLFTPEVMTQVCQLIISLVRETVHRPQSTVRDLIERNQASLLPLQALAAKYAPPAANPPSAVSSPRRTALPKEVQRLNRVKTGRPVFWIHAGMGGVESYQGLAQRSARPFFGIHARGWLDDQPPIVGLSAMAAYYLELIRSVQGGGPYDLGGYSLGGLLAYEITRLAQLEGETVNSIVMLDSLDSTALKRIRLSPKSDVLQTINTALLISAQGGAGGRKSPLIRCDEVDSTLDDAAFLEQLIELARARGLTLSDRQIRTLVRRRSKVQQSYHSAEFVLKPLPAAAAVPVYYFRNQSGLFLGDLGPYYMLPGDSIELDHFDYWAEWRRELPDLQVIDVPARSHGTFLSDAKVQRIIGDCCERLYAAVGEGSGK